MLISRNDTEAARDAIQGLIFFSCHRPRTKAERSEVDSDWQTIERLKPDIIDIPGRDSKEWLFQLRDAAWKVHGWIFHHQSGDRPSKDLQHLKECQDTLRTIFTSDDYVDGGNGGTRPEKTPKTRMKRHVAEPLIAHHLTQRPHDTAVQVADKVGCSVGVVGESSAWKLNQERLKIAKLQGMDPRAVKLNEQAVNEAGGGKMRQLHDSRQQADGIDDKLDEAELALFKQIADYETQHPGATPEQVACATGCTAGDVEHRQATLNRLVEEQGDDQLEDLDVEDPGAQRGTRRKWVPKRV